MRALVSDSIRIRNGWPTLSDIAQLIISNLFVCWWFRFVYRAQFRLAAPLASGPVVYASNHRAFLDPMLIGMRSPVPIAYFAKASLWENPIFRWTLNVFKGIPIDRDNPGMGSMKGAIDRLKNGIPILVFPEGTRTRSGRVGHFKDGPALFARRGGVPIIPVYVVRTEQCWPRGKPLPLLSSAKTEVRFGKPMLAPKELPPREQDAWLTRRLAAWMHNQERKCLGSKP
ncbi:MAG: lysophospholipid acyltransferase family protein [Planctomycetota bacterium]